MMASMHDQLMCSICLELYNDPVRLACFHAFCRKCISDNLKIPNRSPMCPECNAPTCVNSFKKDFKLAALVQTIEDTPKCSEHNDEVDTLEECKAHVLCRTCCKLLCVKCAFGEKHKTHDMDDLKTAIAKQKDVLAKRIPAVKRKMDEYNKQLCETKKAQKDLSTFDMECLGNFSLLMARFEGCLKTLKKRGECAVSTQAKEMRKLYMKMEYKLEQKLKYGEYLMRSNDDVEKDPVSSIRIMKEDTSKGYDFDSLCMTRLPVKATPAYVFKHCPVIEEQILCLQKLVNGCLERIRDGTLGNNDLLSRSPPVHGVKPSSTSPSGVSPSTSRHTHSESLSQEVPSGSGIKSNNKTQDSKSEETKASQNQNLADNLSFLEHAGIPSSHQSHRHSSSKSHHKTSSANKKKRKRERYWWDSDYSDHDPAYDDPYYNY